MARYRRKKAFYEVIGRKWSKSGRDKSLEQPPTGRHGRDRIIMPDAERATRWPTKPRVVQFNAGRIEISMSYQFGIALVLGVIALILVVFRLGQTTSPSSRAVTESSVETLEITAKTAPEPAVDVQQRPEEVEEIEPVRLKGNNRIVIQTYLTRADLEPVKEYFAQLGIETEIKKIDDWYYLVTRDKYENPERQGTDGYLAKQKIIELGAEYKAPPGYETFGKTPFYDAYGMNFSD
jgi:hypothetical protein